jgi:type IV secretion system protein VirB9
MKRTITTLLALTLASAAVAEELPAPGRRDGRIRTVDYKPDEVVLIATQLFTSTQIEFAADENITFVGIGNPSWDVVPKNNFLFVKPRERHPASNLNVVTERANGERRSYQMVLGVMPDRSRDPAFVLVRFAYSADEASKRRLESAAKDVTEKSANADRVLARDEKSGPRNFAYSVQGEADFEPIEVFDNGKVTTLRFKGVTEMPAIYLGKEDGTEELVPKSVSGDAVLVHALAKKLILRRGNRVLCVFNEAFQPDGLEPGTKTTSPFVTRIVTSPPATTPAKPKK